MWIQTEKGNILNLKKAKCVSIKQEMAHFLIIAEYGEDWAIPFKKFEDRKEAQKYVDKLFFRLCGSNNKKKGT